MSQVTVRPRNWRPKKTSEDSFDTDEEMTAEPDLSAPVDPQELAGLP